MNRRREEAIDQFQEVQKSLHTFDLMSKNYFKSLDELEVYEELDCVMTPKIEEFDVVSNDK